MRAARTFLIILLGVVAASLSGCVYLSGYRILDPDYQEVKPAPHKPRVTGLARMMNDSSGDLVAVVFAHGGGPDQTPGYSKELRTALVKQLGLSTAPVCVGPWPVPDDDTVPYRPRPGPDSPREADKRALFSMCQYRDGAHRPLRFYELYWQPLWLSIWKANLAFDDENKLGALWLNHYAKKQLLNDRFAEEVLYGGKFRRELLRPVRHLLCLISNDAYAVALFANALADRPERCTFRMADAPVVHKRIVAVGMSLGSVMLIDGMAAARDEAKTAADEVMSQMEALFMLSNQLPVSRLADIRAVPSTDDPQPVVSSKFVDLLQHRCERRGRPDPPSETPACPPLEIVAVTDPNDVVGYFVWRAQIPPGAGWPYAVWTNALVHNARWNVPGVAANPVNAHVDHAKNGDVIEIIVCGVPARCGDAAGTR